MKKIKLEKLIKAPWNYKENNDELMTKLKENLKINKQVENLVVRELDAESFEVVNGNHRLDAMRFLGFKSAWCFNLGDISLASAKRIAIETNETRFKSDDNKLHDLLAELAIEFDVEDMLKTMPYDMDELNDLLTTDQEMFEEEQEEIKAKPKKKTDIITYVIKLKKKDMAIWEDLEAVVSKYETAEIREK